MSTQNKETKYVQRHIFSPKKVDAALIKYLEDLYGSSRGKVSPTIVEIVAKELKSKKYL